MTVVRVALADRPYDVHVARGALDEVGSVVAASTRARRALLVSQPPVADHYADRVEASLRDAGLELTRHVFADGEANKTAATLQDVWGAAAAVPMAVSYTHLTLPTIYSV